MGVKEATVVVVWVVTMAGMGHTQSPTCPQHSNLTLRPEPCVWAKESQEIADRDGFLDWLIGGCNAGDNRCDAPRGGEEHHVEYESYDGWYNNFAKPSQGAVDTPLLRLLPPAYSDGAYQPSNRTTNPLRVSKQLMEGPNGNYSKSGRTAFQVFFGQQVVEEILDSQGAGCPPEYFNIPVESDHEYFTTHPGLDTLPFLRTRYDMTTGFSPNNPRQQLNEITPYLDGGLVYGTAKGWADVLRLFQNGSIAPGGLLGWHDELGEGFPARNTQRLPMANPPPPANHTEYVERSYTANVDRFFKIGNPRGNENPFILTFGIVWFRWHNVIAKKLKERNNRWNDEKIFNEARKWVIATYQAIVLYDWIPKYLRTEMSSYEGYKPTTDPQVSQVFQTAAMRFGHTLVTSGVHLRDRSSSMCNTVPYSLVSGPGHRMGGVRTCNSFWRSPELFTNDKENFERFLMGLSSQSTEREDHIIVDDLRGRVFGPLEFSRRDLMAVNIQRGRDHGLPDYNTARVHFGLEPLRDLTLDEIKDKTNTEVEDEVLNRLGQLYDDPGKVDIWPGGLLETTHGPGQLFSEVIKDQFQRVRDGDRFWFENDKNDLFTKEERDRLKQVKIIDVLLSITNLLPGVDIQEDPFTAVHDENKVSQECEQQLDQEIPCLLSTGRTTTCRYLPQVSDSNTEHCTSPKTYDYFSGSEVSYVLTFTFVLESCVALLIFVLVKAKWKVSRETKRSFKTIKVKSNIHKAKEHVAFRENRYILMELDKEAKRIQVYNTNNHLLRTLDLRSVSELNVRHLHDFSSLIITVSHHYDLYVMFEDGFHGEQLYEELQKFCQHLNLNFVPKQETKTSIKRGVMTVYQREKLLAEFSRTVLQNAFGDSKTAKATGNYISVAGKQMSEFLSMEITQAELANQMGMLPDSIFVQQLFRLMDTDQSGFITIKEFWDVMVVFAQGNPDEKSRLIFNIYDLSHQGYISSQDLMSIVKSTLGTEGKNRDLTQVVQTMLESVGLKNDQTIDYEKFKTIFALQGDVFKNVNIDVQNEAKKGGKRGVSRFSLYGHIPVGGFAAENARHKYEEAKQEVEVEELEGESESSIPIFNFLKQHYNVLVNRIRSEIQYVFWRMLYTIVMLLIFIERAYYYSIEREHAGLRKIAGYGVTVTRGAASAMMFTYSTLLITMCRNLFSVLRSTNLHRIVPFDYMIDMHRYIGFWALVFTLIHIIGHAINFYHISTQTPSDLTCLFRDFYRSTHVLPKFHYWCWETITGLTGVLLTLQAALIYVFAYFGRRHFFPFFWLTHNTYPIFYGLMILHGSGRLVQPPFFHFFFLGPCILFALDKLVSISRNTVKLDVISAKQLPSSVTRLEIRRPTNFSFQSGQWVKIASTGIGEQEYHPFTLSSAPHEPNLTLHIRAVGPWTKKLAELYTDQAPGYKYPQIYMDGPFGEGHQTWWDYEVVVLVAGGIGVTPFSSILKDIAYKLSNSQTLLRTKKVMFMWTTRSQKQYEWLTDILQEVETTDKKNVIHNHVFITQFKDKFDLRTIMLYLAERHFQRVSGTSLFTGLRAITHFGRPNFVSVFKTIKNKYKSTSIIGVFTCGSPNLSHSVELGCQEMNKEDGPVYRHYYENF